MEKMDLENLEDACEEPAVEKLTIEETKAKKRAEDLDYATNRNVAQGMMDLALITANSNQLRLVLTYTQRSLTFYISVFLILLSLALQIAVGIALIFKARRGRKSGKWRTRKFLVGGIFLITIINIVIAGITTANQTEVEGAV